MAIESMQDAIAAGIVKCYIDARSGRYYDWSRSSNDGTPTSITLGYDGALYDVNGSVITVADAVSLQSIEGHLGILADDFSDTLDNVYLSKRDFSGAQYSWYTSSGVLSFNDGALTRTLSTSIAGARSHAVNYKSLETPEGFTDGLPVGSYSGGVTVGPSTADLLIGNLYTLTGAFKFRNTLQAIWVMNRKLTDAEALAIYTDVRDTDFGTTETFQEGDVDLFQTADDGDIDETGGITRMTGRFSTGTYLTLFGGNEDDAGGSDDTLEWWGNKIETDPARKYRSETQHILQSMPNTSENRIKLEQAILRDMEWVKDIDAASSVTADAIVPQRNRVDISVDTEANGIKENFRYVGNWEATQ